MDRGRREWGGHGGGDWVARLTLRKAVAGCDDRRSNRLSVYVLRMDVTTCQVKVY